jgi:hypothetical protein
MNKFLKSDVSKLRGRQAERKEEKEKKISLKLWKYKVPLGLNFLHLLPICAKMGLRLPRRHASAPADTRESLACGLDRGA